MSALAEVAAAVDPALAEHAVADPGPDRYADGVADPHRSFTIEAVYEGYLLHYGEPRLIAGHDADLALLAGDYLYALGIERLAKLGDPAAVRELGELIADCAQLHTEGREAAAPDRWQVAARAIGGVK